MRIYIDSSAAAKLLVLEAESVALKSYLVAASDEHFVSSVLLETELRRTAHHQGVPQVEASAVLARIDLIDVPRAVFQQAGLLPLAGLRSLDALHLASAVRAESGALLSYDRRLNDAAQVLGLPTISPT